MDEGLLVIDGKLSDGVTFEQLETALWETLDELNAHPLSESEAARLLIKIRTVKEFQEQGLLNRAMNLCIYELLGDANGVNEENALYQSVTAKHIQELGKTMLRRENCSVLRVKAIQA
jgi:predicted Zn-dependent peptidase